MGAYISALAGNRPVNAEKYGQQHDEKFYWNRPSLLKESKFVILVLTHFSCLDILVFAYLF